jgi:stalled ribosome rescue protein Dom34
MLFGPQAKSIVMTIKNKKQFGVWMDSQHATVVGREKVDTGNFIVLHHSKNEGAGSNSNENAENNKERTTLHQFFKQISSHMQNVEEVHVTGTGTAQEQFIHYLRDTPQFKNAIAKESTSNKMNDEKLVEYIAGKFN